MKIIHGNDYYDSANYGIDQSITFVRDGKIPDINWRAAFKDVYVRPDVFLKNPSHKLHNFQLGYAFCAGEVVPFMRHMVDTSKNPHTGYKAYANNDICLAGMRNTTATFYYNVDDALAAFVNAGFTEKTWKGNTFRIRGDLAINDHFARRNPQWAHLLISNKIVTGYYYPSNSRTPDIEINSDCMTAIKFYQYKDAFTTNQDIAGFVGGVLPANENPMVTLSDKHKIGKAGFDYVTSFRKGKSK